MFEVFVPGTPIPQGSKSAAVINGRAVMFEANKRHKAWREIMREHFKEAPLAVNPVRIELIFAFNKPKTVKREHPSVKPDIDKLCRNVLDAGTGLLFKDDALVVIMNARKTYSPREGVLVRCYEITNP